MDSEKSKQSISVNQSDWSIGLYTDREKLSGTIDRRILGGIFLGVNVITDIKEMKPLPLIGLRLEF